MIILLFDVQKTDISDEVAGAIKRLEKHSDKLRVALNKSDSVSHQHLMKVYGALLWSLGRIISTPEVTRVYIGSFWSEPLRNEDTQNLIETEMNDLLSELKALPKMGAVRKINDMVKRIRQIRVHAILLDRVRTEAPSMFGKGKKKVKLLDKLPHIFRNIMKEHGLAVGDFPDIAEFRRDLDANFSDLKTCPKLVKKEKRLLHLENALNVDIPNLLDELPGINSMGARQGDII
mmetsp:Transcript_32520/g.37662  ORF Transcript_32520/g.37662 Transcript_32520/m.37662 type:complete len:233 (+) Transcript_32520:187-885(+)